MTLREILRDIPCLVFEGDAGVEIQGLAYSSKSVEPGFLFAALKGEKSDGLAFIGEAEARGAVAVLSEWPRPQGCRLAWVRAEDAREALALAAAAFYGQPSLRMKTFGITGTKGKTTVTYILEEIVKAAGGRPAVIGTIEYRLPGERLRATHTTPEAPDLQRLLARMVAGGATHAIMEVSSHALEQKRVWGVSFDIAVFTNLSGEHLDYHRSMDAYFEAKKKLFFLDHKRSASVVNIDDPWGQKLIQDLPLRTITFGMSPAAIVRAEKFCLTDNGLEVVIFYPGGRLSVASRLVGKHNVYNILAAAGAALALGIPAEAVAQGIAWQRGVPGRFQTVPNPFGFRTVVDYAHTDNALVNLLETTRELKPRRIILVFGAGGNRDRAKRERMGEVAARLADWTILTSDNPRSEDPLTIIADIEKGFRQAGSSAYEVEPDRKEAIRKALTQARQGDHLLVAGKGHEDTQVFRDRTIAFSDVETIASLIEELKKR
ncbi:MAG: UDP-N-acetylmuramoyl-L-alanyl-D-glutamate--2,6-diaminopimelate ligase [Candidatus Aminicenantes bacterium]|nr:UDP-N-acetylmuramoyl-L-alanyl-D-glutamate--2,6-diaminopimelate ligase [Candidatus Aminicenantes bacterium]